MLHGPTSAGKSSLASALQDSAPVPAFHVALDAFVTMSRRRDVRGPQEERDAYRLHCEKLRSTLAEEGAAAIRSLIQRHPRVGRT